MLLLLCSPFSESLCSVSFEVVSSDKSDVSSSYRFEELMMDADVTMIVEKFGRNIFLKAVYETNVKDNAVATKHFTCIIPAETADRVAFSLDGEQSQITLKSCVVENF